MSEAIRFCCQLTMANYVIMQCIFKLFYNYYSRQIPERKKQRKFTRELHQVVVGQLCHFRSEFGHVHVFDSVFLSNQHFDLDVVNALKVKYVNKISDDLCIRKLAHIICHLVEDIRSCGKSKHVYVETYLRKTSRKSAFFRRVQKIIYALIYKII